MLTCIKRCRDRLNAKSKDNKNCSPATRLSLLEYQPFRVVALLARVPSQVAPAYTSNNQNAR